jgi:hypothetical protein
MKELSDCFLNTEFVIVGDINSWVDHTWDCFDEIDKDNDNQFGNRVSKDFMCNPKEGRKEVD